MMMMMRMMMMSNDDKDNNDGDDDHIDKYVYNEDDDIFPLHAKLVEPL